MFYCKRCDRDFPDDTIECPICHSINVRAYRKKTAYIRRLIIFSDILVLTMFFINVFLFVTCSHYCYVYEYGIFTAHAIYWEIFPALIFVEVVFSFLLLIAPLLSAIAKKRMRQRRRSGVKLMIGIYIGLLIWSIAFPICTFSVTAIFSPILMFCSFQIAIFFALALTTSILLLNYNWDYQ